MTPPRAHSASTRRQRRFATATSIFDGTEIEWSDGLSTKKIYLKGKNKRYEHDIFILVHVGHCQKVKAPTAELCKG
jgi:hypothetical protein